MYFFVRRNQLSEEYTVRPSRHDLRHLRHLTPPTVPEPVAAWPPFQLARGGKIVAKRAPPLFLRIKDIPLDMETILDSATTR